MAASSLRLMTEAHGQAISEACSQKESGSTKSVAETLISQMDGCMMPRVESTIPEGEQGDRRKNKLLFWQEMRLCNAHAPGEESYYGVILGGVDKVGTCWLNTAEKCGLGPTTQVHCVGDGAPWIESLSRRVFGSRSSYLLDFYHLSEYLAAGAQRCARGHNKQWLKHQQNRLKKGQAGLVLAVLEAELEPEHWRDENAPVRRAHRYLKERISQVDYPKAIAKGLPIGSGEIESANRAVLQLRLKLPGAWWAEDNLLHMACLRVCRANDEWDQYWENLRCNNAA